MPILSFQLFKLKTWESSLTSLFRFFYILPLIHQQIMSGILSKNIQDLTNSDYLYSDYLGLLLLLSCFSRVRLCPTP